LSVSAVSSSSSSIIQNALEAALLARTKAAASPVSTASSAATSTSSSASDALTQDMVTLLKALASGDTTGAKTDLAKLKADLKAQETTVMPPQPRRTSPSFRQT
jgi:hypothetical protein